MTQSFHVRIEDLKLRGQELRDGVPPVPASTDAARRAFFLETFGCQMNDHDSEKVAGGARSRGDQQREAAATPSLILYNTCRHREKAAQKSFSAAGGYLGKENAR